MTGMKGEDEKHPINTKLIINITEHNKTKHIRQYIFFMFNFQ